MGNTSLCRKTLVHHVAVFGGKVRDTQMNHIGTDIHISPLDFQVVNNLGKVIMARKVPTSALNFIEFVRSVPRQTCS